MFIVKFSHTNQKRTNELKKTIDNVVDYICRRMSFKETKILSDKDSVELVCGGDHIESNDEFITVELTVKKTFKINKKDLADNYELDKSLTNIKHFCDQAKSIESLEYLPIGLRKD